MVNFYASVNKFCFVLCCSCPPMYPSLGISKSVLNQTLFEISPLSNPVFEVVVSGSRLNYLYPFGGGVSNVLLCAVLSLSAYGPFSWISKSV